MGKHVKHYNIYTARAEFNKNVKNYVFLQQKVKYVVLTSWAISVGGRQTFSGMGRSIFMENTPMFCKHQDNMKMKKVIGALFGEN